jgi:hypothetical protein
LFRAGLAATMHEMEIPMRWRNLAFWAKQLLVEDDGKRADGICRTCGDLARIDEEHHRVCPRGRLIATLAEIQADE